MTLPWQILRNIFFVVLFLSSSVGFAAGEDCPIPYEMSYERLRWAQIWYNRRISDKKRARECSEYRVTTLTDRLFEHHKKCQSEQMQTDDFELFSQCRKLSSQMLQQIGDDVEFLSEKAYTSAKIDKLVIELVNNYLIGPKYFPKDPSVVDNYISGAVRIIQAYKQLVNGGEELDVDVQYKIDGFPKLIFVDVTRFHRN